MSAAAETDLISSDIVVWHAYDPAVKAELFSSALLTPTGTFFVDPILLGESALTDLQRQRSIAGIVVTNANHHRASPELAKRFSIPVFAHCASFPDAKPSAFHDVAEGDEISEGLGVIAIEGAAPGEIALHYRPNGGTLVVGDALLNFDPYGFTFLPAKYCLNQKTMKRSLRKLLDCKAERILFAHGTPILSGATARLQRLLEVDRKS